MTRMDEAIERAAFRRYVEEGFVIACYGVDGIQSWYMDREDVRERYRRKALDAGVVDRWTDEKTGIYHYDFAQSMPWITASSVWSMGAPVEYLERIAAGE